MEIKDAQGNLVRSFSSQKNTSFKSYAGGPPAEPVLSKKKGLNRIVWDMRYETMPGIPQAYIEASYRGHKAIPGEYTLTLNVGEETKNTTFKILPNPLYDIQPKDYQEYHSFMSTMEKNLTEMHQMTNNLMDTYQRIQSITKKLPKETKYEVIKKEGEELLKRIKTWDEEMVQRKSKAYDDVENFPNKFTANYMFLINQTESDLPRINQASRDRLKELASQWSTLKSQAEELISKDIPKFNNTLWNAGIGAVWIEQTSK